MARLSSKASRLCTQLLRWYAIIHPRLSDSTQPPQLVDLSAAQDVEAGDGTTSVVVLAGSLLGAAEKMLQKGIHPTIVAESFLRASAKAVEYLEEISTPVDLSDRGSLLRAASTSLNSKVSSIPFHRRNSVTFCRSFPNIPPLLLPSPSMRFPGSSPPPLPTSISEMSGS